MSPLRDKLFNLQKEEILKEFFGEDYDTASIVEKNRVFALVESSVNMEVDKLLREYIENYKLTSPQAKQNQLLQIVFTVINVVLTVGVAFAVNEKAWVFVVILSIIMAIAHAIPYIINRD